MTTRRAAVVLAGEVVALVVCALILPWEALYRAVRRRR